MNVAVEKQVYVIIMARSRNVSYFRTSLSVVGTTSQHTGTWLRKMLRRLTAGFQIDVKNISTIFDVADTRSPSLTRSLLRATLFT